MGVKFIAKETTVAEGPSRASNLEPYNYQADALAASLSVEAMSHCPYLLHKFVINYLFDYYSVCLVYSSYRLLY